MGFTRSELIVVVVIICVLIALLTPAVHQARELARRTQSQNNLKQIGLAFHNYHDVYEIFPPGGTFDADGRGYHGWMLSITPFMDANNLMNRVDWSQPWDSARNAGELLFLIPSFQIPGEPSQVGFWEFNQAHYSANANLLAANSAVPLKDIENHSKTFIVAELGGDFVPWGCPYNFRPLKDLNAKPPTYGRYSRDGAFFLFVDGQVDFVSNEGFSTLRDSLRGPELAGFEAMPANIVRPNEFPVPKDTLVPSRLKLTGKFPRDAIGIMDYRGKFVRLEMGTRGKGGPDDAQEADLAIIAKHVDLEELTFRGAFSDQVLPQLQKLVHLRKLNLKSDQISAAGLAFIEQLPELKELTVEGKGISAADRQQLRKRMPNCEITPDGP